MSRTYRLTTKGINKTWVSKWPRRCSEEEYQEWVNGPHFYWMSTPSSWNHTFHEKPMRAKTRNLLAKIKNGSLDSKEAVFPLFKKPHIYYW